MTPYGFLQLEEIKIFFGILLLPGLIKKGKYNDYCKIDFTQWTPSFTEVMPRDRFLQLKSILDFNNSEDPTYDANADDRDRLP